MWNDIGRNYLLGHRKKKGQIFNEDFYLPLYLPLWLEESKDKHLPECICLGAYFASYSNICLLLMCKIWLKKEMCQQKPEVGTSDRIPIF
jgi:hypothetical protein